MRNYDLTFVLPSDLNDEEQQAVLATLQGWITEQKGQVLHLDPWGRRRLAYSINEYAEGYYFSLDAELDPNATPDLERNIKLSGKFLRYLLIRKEKETAPAEEPAAQE